jgi:hypothetical protein
MQMSKDAGFHCWIDINALTDEGINSDLDVGPYRHIQNVPLGTCLNKLLEPYQLTYDVIGAVVVITTQTALESSSSIRIYDLGESMRLVSRDQVDSLDSVLGRAITGEHVRWRLLDGEGGNASFATTRHLIVNQTRRAHADIERFLDDLKQQQLPFPIDPETQELELRVYTAADIPTATDLETVLPQLLGQLWNKGGSIKRAGASLLILQTKFSHDEILEVMTKLDESVAKRAASSGVEPPADRRDAVKKPPDSPM